jgi:hypothetical protein
MKTILLILAAATMTGCATIATGTKDNVSFVSNPEGATVSVSGKVIGKTPVSADLPRKRDQMIVFEKDGYKPLTMKLETQMNSWFWGNIVIGGLFGSTTDSASGAVYRYSPSQYMVTLEPSSTALAIEKGTTLSSGQRIKDFVVMSYPQISADLRSGQGEYLSSLYSLLNIPPDRQPETLKRLRDLSSKYPAIPEFADKVNDLAQTK